MVWLPNPDAYENKKGCCRYLKKELEAIEKATSETASEVKTDEIDDETTSETTSEDQNNESDDEDDELLRNCCLSDHVECLKQLIPRKYDVNTPDKDYFFPIQFAVSNGHLDSLKYLISCGADVNVIGRDGTALYCAADYGHYSCVVELLKHNADVTIKNRNGYTAADIARQENYDLKIGRLQGRKACADYFEKLDWKKVLLSDMKEQLKQMSVVHKETVANLKNEVIKYKEEAVVNAEVMRNEMSQLKSQLDQVLEVLKVSKK